MTLTLLRIKNNLISSILKYKNIFDQQAVFIPLNNRRIFSPYQRADYAQTSFAINVIDILTVINDERFAGLPQELVWKIILATI